MKFGANARQRVESLLDGRTPTTSITLWLDREKGVLHLIRREIEVGGVLRGIEYECELPDFKERRSRLLYSIQAPQWVGFYSDILADARTKRSEAGLRWQYGPWYAFGVAGEFFQAEGLAIEHVCEECRILNEALTSRRGADADKSTAVPVTMDNDAFIDGLILLEQSRRQSREEELATRIMWFDVFAETLCMPVPERDGGQAE